MVEFEFALIPLIIKSNVEGSRMERLDNNINKENITKL